jgi:uncharacterized iron-regulated membrane protein
MKEGFRQCMAWLHTWVGLVTGWVLFLVFATGTAGYFQYEITRWMTPELPLRPAMPAVSTAQGVATAQALLARQAGDAQRWVIHVDGGRDSMDWRLHWPGLQENLDHGYGSIVIDPLSGTRLNTGAGRPRDTGGGNALYRMHYELHAMPREAAIQIVGFSTMLMLLAIVSGVITHKKIFADFFTFRPGKGQRSWLDAHNVVSVMALPFFLVITYSGLVFFMDHYLPAAMHAEYGWDKQWPNDGYSTPLNPRANPRFDPGFRPNPEWDDAPPGSGQRAALVDLRIPLRAAEAAWGAGQVSRIWIEHPGQAEARVTIFRQFPGPMRSEQAMLFDGVSGQPSAAPIQRSHASGVWQVQNLLTDLHEGVFAGWTLRWLYFLSGLLGCAMIATGLLLWTVKRRRKQESEFGFRLVDTLNIATVAGLWTALAAYFWANRLLPLDMASRAAWERHSMYIVWGLMLAHAALRLRFTGSLRVWQEQLWLAAAALCALPLLNALTTERHLGVTLRAGDWVLASVDLTLLALGLGLAAAAAKVGRKRRLAGASA